MEAKKLWTDCHQVINLKTGPCEQCRYVAFGTNIEMFKSSDHEWNQYGAENPYFGVISDERMHKDNLTEEALVEFWRTGQEHVDAVFQNIKNHICPNFEPQHALDFGCGVGRVLFALGTKCSHVTGIDVSSPMLEEAKRQAEKKALTNVTFIESSDCHEVGENLFDLVHSFIVLQHIPVVRGYAILDRLLATLRPGGVGVLHLTFNNPGYKTWKLSRMVPFNKQLRNLRRGKSLNAPFMQMNEYDLNKIMKKIMNLGVQTTFIEFTDHGGVQGVNIYFQQCQVPRRA